jgi:hypothetical protein
MSKDEKFSVCENGKLIYRWERVQAETRMLRQMPLYVGQTDLPEVTIVEMEGEQWLDFDSGYNNFPPIPVTDMLWLLGN